MSCLFTSFCKTQEGATGAERAAASAAVQSRRFEQDDQLRAVQSREGSQLQVAVIGFSGCFLALPPVGGKFTNDGCVAPLADSEGAQVPFHQLERG